MPAVSKAQQRFMGMVHAADKGETPASPEVAKVSASMKDSDAKDFASTKHKGLPNHVRETIKGIVREVLRENYTISEMSPNDVHFKDIMNMFDKGGSFTKKKVAAVVTKNPNSNRNKIADYLKDMDYSEIIEVEDELGIKESVSEAFVKGKTYGGTKCEGGCYVGKEGLKKIIKISKDNPNNVFMFRQDNFSGLQPHFIKNGVIAKANTINPSYDLDKSKVRNLNIGKDVILAVRLFESINEVKFDSEGQMKIKKQYNSVSDFEKNAKNGDYVWVGKNVKDFKNIGQSYLSKVVGKDSEGNVILTPWKRNKKYTIPQKDQLVIVVESLNESVDTKDGKVLSNGNLIGYYSFDRDSDSFWVDDVKKGKGQLSFDTKKEVADYFKKNEKDAIKHLGKMRNESINEDHDCGCNVNHDCGCGGMHAH